MDPFYSGEIIAELMPVAHLPTLAEELPLKDFEQEGERESQVETFDTIACLRIDPLPLEIATNAILDQKASEARGQDDPRAPVAKNRGGRRQEDIGRLLSICKDFEVNFRSKDDGRLTPILEQMQEEQLPQRIKSCLKKLAQDYKVGSEVADGNRAEFDQAVQLRYLYKSWKRDWKRAMRSWKEEVGTDQFRTTAEADADESPVAVAFSPADPSQANTAGRGVLDAADKEDFLVKEDVLDLKALPGLNSAFEPVPILPRDTGGLLGAISSVPPPEVAVEETKKSGAEVQEDAVMQDEEAQSLKDDACLEEKPPSEVGSTASEISPALKKEKLTADLEAKEDSRVQDEAGAQEVEEVQPPSLSRAQGAREKAVLEDDHRLHPERRLASSVDAQNPRRQREQAMLGPNDKELFMVRFPTLSSKPKGPAVLPWDRVRSLFPRVDELPLYEKHGSKQVTNSSEQTGAQARGDAATDLIPLSDAGEQAQTAAGGEILGSTSRGPSLLHKDQNHASHSQAGELEAKEQISVEVQADAPSLQLKNLTDYSSHLQEMNGFFEKLKRAYLDDTNETSDKLQTAIRDLAAPDARKDSKEKLMNEEEAAVQSNSKDNCKAEPVLKSKSNQAGEKDEAGEIYRKEKLNEEPSRSVLLHDEGEATAAPKPAELTSKDESEKEKKQPPLLLCQTEPKQEEPTLESVLKDLLQIQPSLASKPAVFSLLPTLG